MTRSDAKRYRQARELASRIGAKKVIIIIAMNKAIEFVKRDKIAQILLGVVGLLFLLAIFKGGKKEQSLPPAPPPQAVKPEAPVVQPLPSGVSNPPSPQEAFQTLPVEKPAEKPEEKPEEENKAEKKPEGVQKKKKKEARKQKERQEGRKQERGEQKAEGKFFEGYGLVCVVGGSCALYDSKTGETFREGSEIRGWRIEKISPQGALLRKGDEVIREDF